MGLIKEPEGIDFIINSKPLTKEQEVQLSKFIAKRKLEIAEIEKSRRSAKASESLPGDLLPEGEQTKEY